MEEVKKFILQFLNKEAECWTKSELNNLDAFNKSIKELYSMATDDMDEAFGIFEEDELDEEDEPTTFQPAYLFKISQYENTDFNTIWVGYTSYKNSYGDVNETGISRGFIFSEIDGELKVIGNISAALNERTMKPEGWKKSMLNPSNLDIHNLGRFVSAERYNEPSDDAFSLQDYLANK